MPRLITWWPCAFETFRDPNAIPVHRDAQFLSARIIIESRRRWNVANRIRRDALGAPLLIGFQQRRHEVVHWVTLLARASLVTMLFVERRSGMLVREFGCAVEHGRDRLPQRVDDGPPALR